MDESLNAFLEQLLVDKGMTTLTGEVREEVKAGMAERLLDEINRAIIEALPDDKAAELDKLLDDENFGQNEMVDFVRDCGVDVLRITAGTMAQFRSFYLADPFKEEVENNKEEGNAEA